MSTVVEPVKAMETPLSGHRHATELVEALRDRLDERPRLTHTVAFS